MAMMSVAQGEQDAALAKNLVQRMGRVHADDVSHALDIAFSAIASIVGGVMMDAVTVTPARLPVRTKASSSSCRSAAVAAFGL
jgi:hypothetical protein